MRRGRGYSWQELGGAGVEREATAGESWVGLVWRGRLQLVRVGWGWCGEGGATAGEKRVGLVAETNTFSAVIIC